MIKVIDEVTGMAIKIEVVGQPYQYQVRVGKVGTWTIARGRTAGQVKTGEKWEAPMYFGRLDQALKGVIKVISESEGVPVESVKIVGEAGWNANIESNNRIESLIEKMHNEFNHLLAEHGKDLAGLSKMLAKGKVEVDEDDSVSNEEEDSEEDSIEETQDPLSFPKLEAAMKAKSKLF